MRHTATLLGALAAAGAIALLPSAQAFAGTGTLNLSGQTITNPSGCYNSAQWPLTVTNNTTEPLIVFSGSNCTGPAVGMVAPGNSETFEFGASVYAS